MNGLLSKCIVAGLIACTAWAEDPILVFEPLAQPLKLPPGLVQTLPVNKTGSLFGDTLRAVDCTEDKDLPFGLCGNQLFGGLVMTDSHLSGVIQIRFHPPVRNVSHFEVYVNALTGDDSALTAPSGYDLPVLFNQVSDAPARISEGDLDLTTGGVSKLQFHVLFRNTALLALGNVNPKLVAPVITFPGVRGHAWARFQQRADGLLDFTFRGSTFLPLGKDVLGDPVRFPLPLCGPGFRCASILSRGTSLHPHLYLSTREPEGPECGANCPDIPFNSVREFNIFTHSTSFGDDFNLDIPQLGGNGPGRSHLQGRLLIQFGPKTGDSVPIAITSLVPEGLLAKPPESPLLGPGFAPGLLGQPEVLPFPLLNYKLDRVVFVDEPFNFVHAAINLKTGRLIGDAVWPAYYGQSLADVLFRQNDGRISPDPFFMLADIPHPPQAETRYALFEKGPNGQLIFRLSAEHKRSFATFRFPSPDYIKANSFIAGPEGTLDLFLRIQASMPVDTPSARMTGGASNVLSSLGDRFNYSYSMPCNPGGQSFAFEYTNSNSGATGGTFRMNRLAAVNCFNSRTSRLPAGSHDTVQFSGFGAWSKDASNAKPRFVSVQVSTNPEFPYVGVLLFKDPDADGDVVQSSANTRPAVKPLP
ncbi:MAG: hypothetical protein ACRD8O_18030 [Bryobacteraceae bacterium]